MIIRNILTLIIQVEFIDATEMWICSLNLRQHSIYSVILFSSIFPRKVCENVFINKSHLHAVRYSCEWNLCKRLQSCVIIYNYGSVLNWKMLKTFKPYTCQNCLNFSKISVNPCFVQRVCQVSIEKKFRNHFLYLVHMPYGKWIISLSFRWHDIKQP